MLVSLEKPRRSIAPRAKEDAKVIAETEMVVNALGLSRAANLLTVSTVPYSPRSYLPRSLYGA
jgi:hypothetical protein